MNKLEERAYYNNLLDIYGELLSSKQRSILRDDLCMDLSISEIADNNRISRAAVNDAIQKGKAKLDAYESKLHLNEKQSECLDIIADLEEKCTNAEELRLLKRLEELHKNAI
ncbi:MAG: DNA-binding protein [Coprobacillus sp.]|nr:DNA-binding protein [Coprobacillus sp.]